MYNKKYMFAYIFLIILFSSNYVLSAPPQQTENGFQIRSAIPSYLQQGQYFDAHVHVFEVLSGEPVIDNIGCYIHIYNKNGTHVYEGYDDVASHNFDYGWDIEGGNFSQLGTHTYIVQCNGTIGVDDLGGFYSGEFYVNGYGEKQTTGNSFSFNMAMLFLMILFVMAVFGMIMVNHYVGKFALYWIAHLLFVVGTFSIWQFNAGYGIYFLGLASIFKILFWVSITAVFPMIIVSFAYIWYIHTMTDEMRNMIEKGMSPEEAYKRSSKRGFY